MIPCWSPPRPSRWAIEPLLNVAFGELPSFIAKAIPANAIKATAINYVVETGPTDRTIVATARRLRCDLIVMGTHGLSGADKLLIGSTTERLFRLTPVPLLAVPPPPAVSGAREPALSWPGPAIMVPVDLRADSESDVRDAADIARAFGASLVVVHVVPQVTATTLVPGGLVGALAHAGGQSTTTT